MKSRQEKARARKEPRTAYCTGCSVTFSKMHFMIKHRHEDSCGGRWLPIEEVFRLEHLRFDREVADREARTEAQELRRILVHGA